MCDEPVPIQTFSPRPTRRHPRRAAQPGGGGRGGPIGGGGLGARGGPPRSARGDGRDARRRQLGSCCGCSRGWPRVSRAASGPSTATSRSAAAQSIASPSPSRTWAPSSRGARTAASAADRARCRAERHRLRAAEPSAEVKSCVLIAGLLAAGSTSVTDPARVATHRAHAAPGPGADRARTRERRYPQVDELELDEIVVPGDPIGCLPDRRRDARVGSARWSLTDMGLNWTRTGFVRIARADGRCDRRRPGGTGRNRRQEPLGARHRRPDRSRPERGPDEVPSRSTS